jgi:hypothetical protein
MRVARVLGARKYSARECLQRKCCDDAYIRDTIRSAHDLRVETRVRSARKVTALRGRKSFLLSRSDSSPIRRVSMRRRVVAARNVETSQTDSWGRRENDDASGLDQALGGSQRRISP